MGDARFVRPLRRLDCAGDPSRAVAASSDADLVKAMAADSRRPYLANVAASELLNRLRTKNTILGVAAEGLCSLDAEGRIAYLNPAAERLLGISLPTTRGSAFHDLVHGEEGTNLCPLALALRSARAVRVEEDAFHGPDAPSFPVTYTVAPVFRDASLDGHVVVFRDASPSRSVLAALEQTEARMTAALRMAGLGRWDWDARHDTMVLSDEAYAALGLRPEGFGGRLRSFLDALPATDRRVLAREMALACERGDEFAVDHRILRPDGTRAIVQTRGRFVYAAEGEPAAAWGTVQRLATPGAGSSVRSPTASRV